MSNATMIPPAATQTPSARQQPAPLPQKGPLARLLETPSDPAATVARIALGIMILPHGLQKAFGLFGGFGFEGTMGYLTGSVGLPWLVALLVIAAELLGGIGLILGAVGRVAALGVGAVMVGAVATSHLANGFFMNWGGRLAPGAEGWEFHLLAVGLAVVVMLRGSGAWSVDRLVPATA